MDRYCGYIIRELQDTAIVGGIELLWETGVTAFLQRITRKRRRSSSTNDNMKILHPLNPQYNDIVLNKDMEYRIVGVVMDKKKRYK